MNQGIKIDRNRFGITEWSGAIGDLGTLLPLTFALVIYNGFPVSRLFFLWGITYLATGYYFKIPISVQPLKAMTVIAITTGITSELLSSTALFYGVLLLLLTGTGLIQWLHRWFSQALVRGIQLGIGLMLGKKAIELVLGKNLFLGGYLTTGWATIGVTVVVMAVLYVGMAQKKPVTILILLISILISWFVGVKPGIESTAAEVIVFTQPQWRFILDAFILLIIPQLPLTLGNAVFAANDACTEYWPERSGKVSAAKLAGSIGLSNVGIGLLGGFPICHGAGGIAAHARFGAKTGGATIILGTILIILAVVDNWSAVLFLIPIPILGALLLFNSWVLIRFMARLPVQEDWLVAAIVGLTAYFTRNLTFAVLAGLTLQKILQFEPIRKRTNQLEQFLLNKLSELTQ